jgi:hypothetical protein
LVYRAYRNGVVIFPCDPCEAGGPTGDSTWAIEWDASAGLEADWYVPGAYGSWSGDGWAFTQPGVGSLLASIMIRLDITASGTVLWDKLTVTVAHENESGHTLTGAFYGDGFTPNGFPVISLPDPGGVVNIANLISDLESTNGEFFQISLSVDFGPLEADSYKIIAIRAEGQGVAPENTGRSC